MAAGKKEDLLAAWGCQDVEEMRPAFELMIEMRDNL